MARMENPKLNRDARARAECFLLCDFAQVENAKLSIVGGGWDQIVPQNLPLDYATYLALKLVLSGELVDRAVGVRIVLSDESGTELGEPIFETRVQGTPTGEPAATEGHGFHEAVVFMAFAVKMALAEPGRFVLRLLVNDELIAETGFAVALAVPE